METRPNTGGDLTSASRNDAQTKRAEALSAAHQTNKVVSYAPATVAVGTAIVEIDAPRE
jgi:hypothetical protein